jgi:hypothetical protein
VIEQGGKSKAPPVWRGGTNGRSRSSAEPQRHRTLRFIYPLSFVWHLHSLHCADTTRGTCIYTASNAQLNTLPTSQSLSYTACNMSLLETSGSRSVRFSFTVRTSTQDSVLVSNGLRCVVTDIRLPFESVFDLTGGTNPDTWSRDGSAYPPHEVNAAFNRHWNDLQAHQQTLQNALNAAVTAGESRITELRRTSEGRATVHAAVHDTTGQTLARLLNPTPPTAEEV